MNQILKMIIFLSPLFGLMGTVRAMPPDFHGGDGQVTFYTYYLKERTTIRYRDGDRILPDAMKKIEGLFRSRDSQQSMPVDSRLIDLLDQIEDHFGVRQVEIISGFRSSAFNKELKTTGHAVANESFHTKGMAADIHLDEIDEKTLRDYAFSLGRGGVGFYPSLDFVHVDVGPVRTWGEEGPRKAWIGEKNDTAPMTLTVSPTRMIGEKRLPSVHIDGAVETDLDIRIEFFDGGLWKDAGPWDGGKGAGRDLPFGKFRLKAAVRGRPDVFQYSNEFYFKRL